MPQNLFAACRVNGQLVSKRVRLDNHVQQAVETIFADQEAQFRNGVAEEVDFDGSWKPEKDEVLTLDVPQEAQVFIDTIQANAVAIPDIDAGNFDREGIKALFTGTSNGGITKVLIQQFSTRQMLSQSKLPLLLDGNTFRRLTDPAFTLDSSLTAIAEDGKLKFKSFHKMRAVVNLIHAYEAATDPEVQVFAGHANFEVADQAAFLELADQTTRKLIHANSRAGTLDDYSAADIGAAANAVGMGIDITNGKIVMPTARPDIKKLLRFLDDGLYEAPLSGQRYITNSKRPA